MHTEFPGSRKFLLIGMHTPLYLSVGKIIIPVYK